MRTLKHRKIRLTSQLVGAILFAAIVGIGSDAQAQTHRGLFNRGARAHRLAPSYESAQLERPAAQDQSSVYQQSVPHYQTDWRRDPSYFSAAPMNSKYYGGFHSSEISRIGVPSGDIGFRGNGLYWTPW